MDRHPPHPRWPGSARPRPDHDDTLTHHKMLEIAVRELLIEKGILDADEVREAVERMDARGPHLGAKVVATCLGRSRLQGPAAEGRQRRLRGGRRADGSPTRLIVVENTPDVHNLVVCTLCSCYPRMVLGIPPDWYKSRAYRSRAVREPRTVLGEFGTQLPDGVDGTGARFDGGHALPGAADAAGGHGRPGRGRARRPRHPRRHDRRHDALASGASGVTARRCAGPGRSSTSRPRRCHRRRRPACSCAALPSIQAKTRHCDWLLAPCLISSSTSEATAAPVLASP